MKWWEGRLRVNGALMMIERDAEGQKFAERRSHQLLGPQVCARSDGTCNGCQLSFSSPPWILCMGVCNDALAGERQKAVSSTGDTFDLSSGPCWQERRRRRRRSVMEREGLEKARPTNDDKGDTKSQVWVNYQFNK